MYMKAISTIRIPHPEHTHNTRIHLERIRDEQVIRIVQLNTLYNYT